MIGDLMFFDEPDKHRDDFDKVRYDEGEYDFPPTVKYLTECLGGEVQAHQIHPLVGVLAADFT